MVDFNYGKYFYEHKIFNIEDDSQINKMSKAIEDAKRIEKYFFKIVPNIDKIQSIIAFSFKINPCLEYIDRINYIRGIVYSQDYIDYNDVIEFYNLITNYEYVVDIPTIFNEKAFCEFENTDFFDNLMVVNKLYEEDIFSNFIIYNSSEEEDEYDEDEEQEDNDFDSNEIPALVCEGAKIINNLEEGTNNVQISEFSEDNTIDITPKQKIAEFKENFNRYVNMVLECKNIDKDKNPKAYMVIILGMTDWFNFVIDIIDTINDIAEAEKKCLRNKLSDFI